MSSTSGTEMIHLGPSGAPAIPDSLELDLDALVERRAQALLADSDLQIAAQVEAWNRTEAALMHQEEIMRQAVAELNDKLMAAERRLSEQSAPTTQDSSMGESEALTPQTRVAATPLPRKKHKVDSRRHQFPKITIPGGRILRSSASRATLQPAGSLRMDTAGRNQSRAPVDDMDTLEDNTGVSLEGTTPAAQAPVELILSSPQPPPKPRNLGRRTGTKSQEKKKKAVVVKAAAEVFRFLPREMPPDMGGLAKAMSLHLRILWSLLDAKAIPVNPPADLLSDFCDRFSNANANQLFVIQTIGPELIPRHLIQIGTSMSAENGRIAEQARSVEQHMLSYIQSCLSRFGLRCWCPDLR
ncbi:hypothetical protein HYPSUDRAFT_209736 [Hypholoma sublateritium FD-334 SS-4]|uniref:Uncharacterized protein n=1 Tax=Hypholoma sublateritium (strain FD-334 SS-4) TaxID=945553 RepID=A0A0D2NXK7_HYPSF|nr:hypothetical protein HYPSUDRAFT_209736 [Hypholoma sublateritium FD-334 SS-4]